MVCPSALLAGGTHLDFAFKAASAGEAAAEETISLPKATTNIKHNSYGFRLSRVFLCAWSKDKRN